MDEDIQIEEDPQRELWELHHALEYESKEKIKEFVNENRDTFNWLGEEIIIDLMRGELNDIR